MCLDVEADGEVAKRWNRVVDADALVVGLLDFLRVPPHLAIEVVAERHCDGKVVVIDLMLQGEAEGPRADG